MSEMRELNLFDCPLRGTNLIEASAGTGKTYTIAALVLRLMLEADLAVGQILVVTFTEAATSELKDRIRRRISDAAEAFAGAQTDDAFFLQLMEKHTETAAVRRKLDTALANFDEASIFTIHGFCLRALQDHAFAGGILLDTLLVADQRDILREVVQDFWREHLSQMSPLFLDYAETSQFSLESLLDLLKEKNLVNPHARIIPSVEVPDCSAQEADFLGEFEETARAWVGAAGEIETILSVHPALNRRTYSPKSIPGWLGIMDAMLSGECLTCNLETPFPKFTWTQIQAAVKKGHSAPDHPFFHRCDRLMEAGGRLRKSYDQVILGLQVKLLGRLQRELGKRKASKNVLFFDDLLLKLEEALNGPGGDALAEAIRARYKAALIDEFQDTDAIQYAIFRKIFEQDSSTLFLIGDPKQAIYGFRGADIFAYMNASKSASRRFTLGENWRSEPCLIEGVNTVFNNRSNPFVYEDIAFQPARPAATKAHECMRIDGRQPEPLTLWFLKASRVSRDKTINKGVARKHIADAVSAEISRILAMGHARRAFIGEQRIIPGDMAVLTRTNMEARMVQKALSRLGIPAVLHGTENLFDSREANEMELLLAAVTAPGEEGLLKAALATDMIGLRGEELDALMGDEAGWEDRLIKFAEYHDTWVKQGFFGMIRLLLSREQVLPRLMSREGGERRCTNVLHLSEVLHRTAVEGDLSVLGLVKWLSTQRDPGTPRLDEYQLRLESDENAVRIVTIHKSKGLEYPIVFCPFAWGGSDAGKCPLVFHDGTDENRLTIDVGSPEWQTNALMAGKEQLAENLRLLYVAMTRARHQCTLVWGPIRNAETSAPAYLLHPSATAEWDGNLPSMKAGSRGLDEDAMWRDLEALRQGSHGCVGLVEMPLEKGVPLEPAGSPASELARRSFDGRIDRSWGISSFSSLVTNQPHRADLADRDETALEHVVVEIVMDGQASDIATHNTFTFPRGAAAGVFLHDLFEHLDLIGWNEADDMKLVSEKLKEHGLDAAWTDTVCTMIQNVLTTPFGSSFGDFTLSMVGKESILKELEFIFPLQRQGRARLLELLSQHVGETTRARGFGSGDRAASETVEGFMKGFIDLVFRFDDRFYILDWKSNHMGNRIEDYGREALERAVEQNHYTLQYTLYTVALHLFLKARLPGYSYESHFGEVFYIFLRGIDPARGPGFGIFRDRPPLNSIETLSAKLTGRQDN